MYEERVTDRNRLIKIQIYRKCITLLLIRFVTDCLRKFIELINLIDCESDIEINTAVTLHV